MSGIDWKQFDRSGHDNFLENNYDFLNQFGNLSKQKREEMIDGAARNHLNRPSFILKMQQDYYLRHHEWYGPLKSTPFDDSGREYRDENGHFDPLPLHPDPTRSGDPRKDTPVGEDRQESTTDDEVPFHVSRR
jgi:hypothetical protein